MLLRHNSFAAIWTTNAAAMAKQIRPKHARCSTAPITTESTRGAVLSSLDLDALGAQYREAKAAVPAHLRKQSDAEQAVTEWLKAHRGVPADELYDRISGAPLDPELARLEQAVQQAAADVLWCRCLVVACGEQIKGRPFDEVVAAQGSRPSVDTVADNHSD